MFCHCGPEITRFDEPVVTIGGQQSAAADTEVHEWLKTSNIDLDLRLKVLEVVDELDRTVRIRQRYP